MNNVDHNDHHARGGVDVNGVMMHVDGNDGGAIAAPSSSPVVPLLYPQLPQPQQTAPAIAVINGGKSGGIYDGLAPAAEHKDTTPPVAFVSPVPSAMVTPLPLASAPSSSSVAIHIEAAPNNNDAPAAAAGAAAEPIVGQPQVKAISMPVKVCRSAPVVITGVTIASLIVSLTLSWMEYGIWWLGYWYDVTGVMYHYNIFGNTRNHENGWWGNPSTPVTQWYYQYRVMGVVLFTVALLTLLCHVAIMVWLVRRRCCCQSRAAIAPSPASSSQWSYHIMACVQAVCGVIMALMWGMDKVIANGLVDYFEHAGPSWANPTKASITSGSTLYIITACAMTVNGCGVLFANQLLNHSVSFVLTLGWVIPFVGSFGSWIVPQSSNTILLAVSFVVYVLYSVEALRSTDTFAAIANAAVIHNEGGGRSTIRRVWFSPSCYTIMSLIGLSWLYRAILPYAVLVGVEQVNHNGNGVNNGKMSVVMSDVVTFGRRYAVAFGVLNLLTLIMMVAAIAMWSNQGFTNIISITATCLYGIYLVAAIVNRPSQSNDWYVFMVLICMSWPFHMKHASRVAVQPFVPFVEVEGQGETNDGAAAHQPQVNPQPEPVAVAV